MRNNGVRLRMRNNEAERRSLFRLIYDRADFSASTEHLCRDAKRRR